jgi:hypothetical protein
MLANDDPRLKSIPDAPQKPQDGRQRRLGEILPQRPPRPASARPKLREKVFGPGRGRPLDRNARARLVHRARALMQRTEKGRAYGVVTAKAFAIFRALLFDFHNVKNGWTFPSYKRIAEAAYCAASTVAEAIKALEAAGLMTWDNRIKRVRERCPDLLGPNGWRWRVIRTSNAYRFPSESDFKSETTTQGLFPSLVTGAAGPPDALEASLSLILAGVRSRNGS